MTRPLAPLGIFDWGIGGLGFYKLLRAALPKQDIVYVADSGSPPYGKLPEVKLRLRVAAVAKDLKGRGAEHLVVACNAASTVLPRLARASSRGELPALHGVIQPALAAARNLPGVIGVTGGRRTILSGIYREGLPGREVIQRIAQPLSALIESGETDSPAMHAAMAKIMAPLAQVKVLILACTHYPAVAPLFQALAAEAAFVDPAEETLRECLRDWGAGFAAAPGRGDEIFLTTGDPEQMRRAAKAAFGVVLANVESYSLP